MKPPWWPLVEQEANATLRQFTEKLRKKLAEPPEKIIKRKNPFLFRARVDDDVHAFARMVIDAYLSSSEETMFGNTLEEIAISICKHARGGQKSTADNIDLEYIKDDVRCVMQIKSGVNWGNSSQKKTLVRDFQKAARILRQGSPSSRVRCIEGICYGKSEIKDVGTHYRYVGHAFWQEVSGWDGSAQAVLEIIGTHASNGLNEARHKACEGLVHYFKQQGIISLPSAGARTTCPAEENLQYAIDWGKLLDLVLK